MQKKDMNTENVITEKTFNGIPISEIKIDCKEFNAWDFFEKYGWDDVSILVEILELNSCLKKTKKH
jgi:hypothetical protein